MGPTPGLGESWNASQAPAALLGVQQSSSRWLQLSGKPGLFFPDHTWAWFWIDRMTFPFLGGGLVLPYISGCLSRWPDILSTPKVPRTMPPSWVCCLLPLASVLLLGQPTQGFSFRSSPGPAPGKTKASEGMWAKQKNMLLKQALQAHAQVLLHMNEKHNETFFMAPGETTHIMVQVRQGGRRKRVGALAQSMAASILAVDLGFHLGLPGSWLNVPVLEPTIFLLPVLPSKCVLTR